MDENLKKIWDRIKANLVKNDEDRCYIVDGRERCGKSLFTIQQACYIDPTFDISRICFTPEELLNCIRTAKPGQVIIFDEAFRGLSSAQSRSKTNQQIKTALMEMGQRNLVLFIVLPSFFLLDIYAATLRSHALFHIAKEPNSKRRMFKVYNERKKWVLYHLGIKHGANYAKPPSRFKGNFYNKYPIDEQAYRKKKSDALNALYNGGTVEVENKDRENWEFWLTVAKLLGDKSNKSLDTISSEAPTRVNRTYVSEIARKWRKHAEKGLAAAANI